MFEVKGLMKTFRNRKTSETVTPVNKVDLYIKEGEHVGLLGPSGCGKTTLSRIAMKLIPPDSGRIFLDGEDVTDLSNRAYRQYRSKMQMVFQNPYASLDPTKTMNWSLSEAYAASGKTPPEHDSLCEMFEIPRDVLDRRPIMISGGEIQRISILRCLACDPKYMILDEPTSMLDVSVQASIMRHIMKLNEKKDKGILLITHDIDLARIFCNRVYLMDDGHIVESGPADEVLWEPKTESGRKYIHSSAR